MPDPGATGGGERTGFTAPSKGSSNLKSRVLSALVFVPGVLALVEWSSWTLLVLVLFVATRCAWEWCQLSLVAGYRPDQRLTLVLTATLVAAIFFIGTDHLFLCVVVVVLILLIAALRHGVECYTANALFGFGAVLYAGLLGSTPILLAHHHYLADAAEARHLIAIVFISIWLTDAAAYLSGRLWGRKKLAPAISPGKTVVGFCGGLVGSLLPLVLYGFLPSFTLGELAVMFLLVGLSGQLGDLVESAIKRDMGVKDAPMLIPGHGGLLDRFDSYFFAFPLVYICVEILSFLRSL